MADRAVIQVLQAAGQMVGDLEVREVAFGHRNRELVAHDLADGEVGIGGVGFGGGEDALFRLVDELHLIVFHLAVVHRACGLQALGVAEAEAGVGGAGRGGVGHGNVQRNRAIAGAASV